MSFRSPDLPAVACQHVVDGDPVLYVDHYQGLWTFMCGREDHEVRSAQAASPALLLLKDPELAEVEDLAEGEFAYRESADADWSFGEVESEEAG